MYGPQIEYSALEPHDAKQENFLVLGPWRHGTGLLRRAAWGTWSTASLLGRSSGHNLSEFFAHYLKDEPGTNTSGFELEDTDSFQTGSNTWRRYSHFPPRDSRPTRLYLGSAGMLSWTSSTTGATTSYVSDPADPIPIGIGPSNPRIPTDRSGSTGSRKISGLFTDRKDLAFGSCLYSPQI